MVEHHEGREYHEIACQFCPKGDSDPVVWLVYEDDTMYAESVMVCNYHKYTAFS